MKSETYEEFTEKFKPKKTTDDCYTPPEIYEAILKWVCDRYNIDPKQTIRPFYPGGNYQAEKYAADMVVMDNPPFSILTQICEFYMERNIKFFLFAPSLTSLSGKKVVDKICHIICDCAITYENGACVKTSFLTNLEPEVIARTSPELTKLVNTTMQNVLKKKHKVMPKYEYPDHIVTAAIMQRWAKYGIEFEVRKGECIAVSRLDAQIKEKKTIFGGGLLLSDAKAKEKAAAEEVTAPRYKEAKHYQLSEREQELVNSLNKTV